MPERSCRQAARADSRNLLKRNWLQAGDLGFEPGFPASTSHWKDVGLTLEKRLSPVFTIQPALVHIVAALG